MSWQVLFLAMVAMIFAFLMSGCWIAAGMGIAGMAGLLISGNVKMIQVLGNLAWSTNNSFTMTAIPLFVLMGEIILHSGLSKNFYLGVAKSTRKIPGGMLIANIVSCAIFSAISGSSVATAAAIGSAAIPEQRRMKFRDRYVCGSLSAGGTLGILIPPSIALIIYGSLTATSIVKLFVAATLPGLLLAGLFVVYTIILAIVQKKHFPNGDSAELSAMKIVDALKGVLPMIILIGGVLGGIYGGIVTPTEAASIGVILAIVISKMFGEFNWKIFKSSLFAAVKTTAMIGYILLGAQIINYVWTKTGVSRELVSAVVGMGLPKWIFFAIVVVMYMILGCFVESNAMIYLTVPVIFPVIMEYGFNELWFGVILVIMLELGQITPPMGINLFVIKGISKETPIKEVIYGVIPYMCIMLIMVVILAFWTDLPLYMVK